MKPHFRIKSEDATKISFEKAQIFYETLSCFQSFANLHTVKIVLFFAKILYVHFLRD
jgi:hypothetical protein